MNARRSISMVSVWLCALLGGLLLWSAPALAQRMHAFSFSFGSEGSGDGQLLRPGELAVNEETGDVYVIDRGNERVEIFSAAGAYIGQFNGSASPTGALSWPNRGPVSFTGEGAIAVDNSSNPLDPSKGDVYVVDVDHELVDKFSASGTYIGQITGVPYEPQFNQEVSEGVSLSGLAVDSNGGLWVESGPDKHVIYQFNDATPVNEYAATVEAQVPRETEKNNITGTVGLALDAEDDFYTGTRPFLGGRLTYPIEFTKTGEALVAKLDSEETTGLAVDESSGDVYVDHESSVAAYSPLHTLIERFGSGQLQVSEGIAVDSATGTVYTANTGSQEIDAFTSFVVPDASTGSVSSLAETSATVSGGVNPDGLPVTACVLEYGTSTAYGQSMPCSPAPGSGSAPVEVTAHLTGLSPLTTYHFRLNVSNANGSNKGQDRTFVTPQPVALSEEAVSDVSSTSALFSAQVNPGGASTTYAFEYGTSVSYGESVPVPAGNLGSETSSVPAFVRVEGLLGETTYHVRVVASNLLGTVYGPDETFTTQTAGGAFMLPDGREWELVSPPNKDGALIASIGESIGDGRAGLIQASVDGDAISYYADGPIGANVSGSSSPAGVTQVLSRRDVDGGWSSEDLTRPRRAIHEGSETEYTFFSADLSRAIVDPFAFGREAALLSPEATENTPYVRQQNLCEAEATASECYQPLVTAGNVPPGIKFGSHEDGPNGEVKALAVTPDLSHVIIQSESALTANATEGPSNLYEWSGGRLQLVSEASLGNLGERDTRNALSSDGSRVFFTMDEKVYMRDTVTGQTVQVNAPAPGVSPPPVNNPEFEMASADGSEVFFSEDYPLTLDSGSRDLYVYDTVTDSLTDLSVDQNAGEAAGLRGVVGASEDGSVVYFVAEGKLAEGARPDEDNLYVESKTGSSWSAPRFVATLSGEDVPDWRAVEWELTSKVSANGQFVTFMSDQSLTGYDNRDAVSGQPDEEVFLYDEATGGLRCVSCDPTGARPDGILDPGKNKAPSERPLVDGPGIWTGRWLAASVPGATMPRENATYFSRVLSDEGRMFFDSSDALVAQATNGKENVYEYEPQGVGSCVRSGGCVSLISSGTSAEESVFLDASESGSDVFFLTAARLASQDVDSAFDVYDAHVCSSAAPCVSEPTVPPPCSSGDACKAAPAPQPAIFGAPASATFSGAGNVTPEVPPVAKKTTKEKTAKCGRGRKLSEGRCVKSKAGRADKKVNRAKTDRGRGR